MSHFFLHPLLRRSRHRSQHRIVTENSFIICSSALLREFYDAAYDFCILSIDFSCFIHSIPHIMLSCAGIIIVSFAKLDREQNVFPMNEMSEWKFLNETCPIDAMHLTDLDALQKLQQMRSFICETK